MNLKVQAILVMAAIVTTVLLGTGGLVKVSGSIHDTHEELGDTTRDLMLQFELVQAIQDYFGEQRELLYGGEDDERMSDSLGRINAAFALLLQEDAAEPEQAGVQRQERGRLAAARELFDTLVVELEKLHQGAEVDAEEREDRAEAIFERRYERQLLPLLDESVRAERDQLLGSMARLEARASNSMRLAFAFALVGFALAAGALFLTLRRLQFDISALARGVQGIGQGDLTVRVPQLKTTELDQLGQGFNRMVEELRQADEAKRLRTQKLIAIGQLAASVGHEIRNPLSAARNAITYLSRVLPQTLAVENQRVEQFLQVANRELGVCNKIIEDLLDFARERPLTFTACSLEALVTEILEVVRKPESTQVKVDISSGFPDIDADRDLLRQLLGNLVQNAVEAIPGDREGAVAVRANLEQGTAHIHVEDNGEGIPENETSRIFEPLVTTKTRGTGLGLSIAANIVKRHRGTIEVVSQLGRGTTFSVLLPLRQGGTP